MFRSIGRPLKTSNPAGILLFLAGYAIAVSLGERVYGSLAVPSPFWLPDSVLLCALLLTPTEEWWLFVAAILPVRLLVGAVPGTPLWFQLVTIANDALKALVVAWLLQRQLGRRVRLDTLNEFLIFLGIAGAVVPLLSALAAAPARYALGDPILNATFQWFLGDTMAQVVVTPMILYWCTRAYRHPNARIRELVILSAGLGVALYFAFVRGDSRYSLILMYVPVPFLVWAAVRLRPFGTANAIALVAIVSMVGAVRGSGLFAAGANHQSVLSLQLFLLVIAVSLLSLAILTAERQTLRECETGFSSRLLEAQERERTRIAQDLHDDVGQRIALLHVSLEQFGGSMDLPAIARSQLNGFTQLTAQMTSDIHSLSHELHPSTLDIVGLEVAIRGLCREFAARHGLQVHFSCHDVPLQLERDVNISLFRIAQEALHNVVKHSGAAAAMVELSRDGDRLALCVSDGGFGFDTRTVHERGGLGLVSMRERLRPIGGRLSIESMPLAGTRISVDVPIGSEVAQPPVLEFGAGA
jgi:signal transduction histidine kinase